MPGAREDNLKEQIEDLKQIICAIVMDCGGSILVRDSTITTVRKNGMALTKERDMEEMGTRLYIPRRMNDHIPQPINTFSEGILRDDGTEDRE